MRCGLESKMGLGPIHSDQRTICFPSRRMPVSWTKETTGPEELCLPKRDRAPAQHSGSVEQQKGSMKSEYEW